MSEDIVPYLLNCRECDADIAVCTAVINGDPAGRSVGQSRTREAHIRNEASFFVPFLRSEDIIAASVEDFRGFVQIEDSCTDAVDIAVAGVDYTVIENQPALVSLDRSSTAAYFKAFPPAFRFSHDMAVMSPEFHILAFRNENITESRMAVIAGA